MIGWCGDFNPQDNSFRYLIAIIATTDTEVPGDLTEVHIPASRFAVATIEGKEPDIFTQAHDLTFREMGKAGLEYDQEKGFEMEWYDEPYCLDREMRIIDIYVPIK
jgi:predicted transcriptional regulator YdeE